MEYHKEQNSPSQYSFIIWYSFFLHFILFEPFKMYFILWPESNFSQLYRTSEPVFNMGPSLCQVPWLMSQSYFLWGQTLRTFLSFLKVLQCTSLILFSVRPTQNPIRNPQAATLILLSNCEEVWVLVENICPTLLTNVRSKTTLRTLVLTCFCSLIGFMITFLKWQPECILVLKLF